MGALNILDMMGGGLRATVFFFCNFTAPGVQNVALSILKRIMC